jgi:hypothetical protein
MKRIVLALVVVVGLLACERAPREDVVQQEQSLEACGHPICAVGGPLVAACDACATVLCAADPYCCSTEWDATCVGEVASICQKSCTAPPPPVDAGDAGEADGGDAAAISCAHPVCAAGGPLTSGCDACVTQLCAADPYCCASEWDATCVTEVTSICGKPCL